ncbi:MAG: TonB-dependent receptor [Chitinophagaceae bacterium]
MSFNVLLKKTFLFVFFFLTLGLSATVFGQNTVIKGKVSGPDGEPLQSVSVTLKGSNIGTTTAADGSFSLTVNKKGGEVLLFSFVGFAEKEVSLGNSTTINVQLETNEQSLNAVIVVGYGTQKKRDVTGSVASVSKDRLTQLPNTNIAEALQGSVPGLQINTNGGGAEGNNVSILIRGRNSITASNNPLIIWDGIPYTGGISEINPNDVESIEILQDASAAAIYGSRGSNGVILVTSKQGKKGKLNITYDGFYASQTLANKPRLLTAQEFYEFKTTRLNSNTNSLSPGEQAVYNSGKFVDWYDLATRQGSKNQHSIAVRGGADKINYYFGATYLNVQGVTVNDQFKRYTLRPSLDIKVTPWLTIASSSQLSFQDRSGLPVEFDDTRSTGGGANFFNPLTNPYNPDGSLALYAYPDNTQARNPLANTLVKNDDNAYRIFTANNVKIDFPFLKGLSYKFNTGIEYENNQRKTYYGRNVALGFETGGTATNYSAVSKNFLVENIFYYINNFKKHSINFTALYSSQSDNFDRDQVEGVGFPNDVLTNYQMNAATLLTSSSANSKGNLISQMGRLNYGYDGRYLLTYTIRRDGYSAFGEGKKYGTFSTIAAAWNITEEGFMQGVNFFKNLKLRTSYGINGNQAVDPYTALARLTSGAYYLSGTTVFPGYFPTALANANLGWESTKSFSVGLDFGILQNRIQGTIDFYSNHTKDLLLNRAISPVQGIGSIIQNIGKTANKGIIIGINSTNIKSANFNWTTNLNFSSNKNKIVDLYGDGKDDVGNRWFIGKPILVYYGLQYDGIFRSQQEVDASLQPTAKPGWVRVKDADGDGVISTSADRVIIGQRDPKFIWGITNTFKYKDFSLMIFFHGVQGVTKDNPLQDDNVFSDTRRNTIKKDWWSPTNPNGTHFSNDQDANKLSVNFYEDASFARLKDVSLAYQLPSSVISRLKIAGLKVYVTGRNLATFTKYKGLDPEFGNQYGLPLQREIVFGATLTL